MLHSISIENFYSIAERQELNFRVPANAPDLHCFSDSQSGPDYRLPSVVGIYGPNASGKSTVLRALTATVAFVQNSFGLPPQNAIPFFNPIFTLQQEDTYDADWYDSTQSESVIKTMQLIRNNNTYSDIKVRIENSSYDKTKHRQVTQKITEYYTWNEDADDYEKK